MWDAGLHFVVGLLGALGIFLAAARAAGEEAFSLPTAPIVVGIACASLSQFLSPWATPVVLALYGAASAAEVRRDRAVKRPR